MSIWDTAISLWSAVAATAAVYVGLKGNRQSRKLMKDDISLTEKGLALSQVAEERYLTTQTPAMFAQPVLIYDHPGAALRPMTDPDAPRWKVVRIEALGERCVLSLAEGKTAIATARGIEGDWYLEGLALSPIRVKFSVRAGFIPDPYEIKVSYRRDNGDTKSQVISVPTSIERR